MFCKISLTVVLSVHVLMVSGQGGALAKMDRLYEQAFFTKSLRKAEKRIGHPDHHQHPLPYLYQSLSLYQLSLHPDKARKYPMAMRNSVMAYHQFRKRDVKKQFSKVRKEDVAALQLAIKTEAHRLSVAGKHAEARFFHTELAAFFQDTTEIYREQFQNETAEESTHAAEIISAGNVRDSLVFTAKKLLGTPYRYGGVTPKGFDCSGFTGYTFRQHHFSLPRQSIHQAVLGKQVSIESAQKGDLAFFGYKKGKETKVTHVAMVISDPGEPLTIIHSTSNHGIMINTVMDSGYWQPRLLYIANVLDTLSVSE